MNEAIREELRRHARRMARLHRIEIVATEQKDKDTLERVHKLIEKETARDQKWLANYGATAAAAGGPAKVGSPDPKDDTKGGAK
jgi:hypothetical protein